jgi:hypothetical protein
MMPAQVNLNFHKQTFALLNEQPVISTTNLRKIEKWERQHGMKLPSSVREWYTIEGAEERLRVDHPEHFCPITLQKSLNRLSRQLEKEPRESTRRFEIGFWDSGAVNYARLSGGEDPDVDFGADGESEMGAFSNFVFCNAWSRVTKSDDFSHAYIWGSWVFYGQEVGANFPLVQADEPLFSRRDMLYLAKHFSEGFHRIITGRWRKGINPQTKEALKTFAPVSVLRVFNSAVRLQILCQGNPTRRTTKAHWDISGKSEKDLLDAVTDSLWGYQTLAQTLASPTKAGRAVLSKLRGRRHAF